MSTIKNVEEFTKKNGKKSWKFTMDDGVVGYITNDKPWEYKSGEAVSYTVEDKGTYKLLTLTRFSGEKEACPPQDKPNLPISKPVETRSPSGGSITPLEVFKAKTEANLRVMEVVLNAFFDGKTDNLKSVEKFNEWKVIMGNTVDELAREQ